MSTRQGGYMRTDHDSEEKAQKGKALSRRDFIKAGGLVAAGAALVGAGPGEAVFNYFFPGDRLRSMGESTFAARIGEKFRLRLALLDTLELELVEVTAWPTKALS